MDELEAFDESEFVYRRIHSRFYDPSLAVPVLLEAFRPNRKDSTGISVFRARFAQPEDCLPRDPAKRSGYALARLAVSDLRNLGLGVRPEPIPDGPPGHAVIPELCWGSYESDRARLKPILLALAKLASNNVVHRTS
jgi:hypothetical protein